MHDSFHTRDTLDLNGKKYTFYSLAKLAEHHPIHRLPFSLKILLENLLRHEDGGHSVSHHHIAALAKWRPEDTPSVEIAFMPARVVLQDFTGVPCVVDLAAMRDAIVALGGKPEWINPQIPSELVIDHSIQVDSFGTEDALQINGQIEFERNAERYSFLRWGQKALDNFKVVPPATGIVHQVNLEYLARVVMVGGTEDELLLYPDTVFGTDSHTTMVNALGILGWGVGGIEAEAAMLGQPSSMLIPQVVGMQLMGHLAEGVTATDVVLTITQRLRTHGVVGKFVEFFGPSLSDLTLADRATISNMAPEYGATCAMFPVDHETLRYLQLSGRPHAQIALIEAYARVQGLWHDAGVPAAHYSEVITLNLADVVPSLAGPRRPQDRIALSRLKSDLQQALTPSFDARRRRIDLIAAERLKDEGGAGTAVGARQSAREHADSTAAAWQLQDGAVVLAAITSCTNTSNPSVMLAAGLLARNAAARGLTTAPWVKTSLAPGSRVVTAYLRQAGLLDALACLGFDVVGYGCTTCIGNSGPLPDDVTAVIHEQDLIVGAVLSGNRNFEGRIHPDIKLNYLASPPLVVAYAIAGTLDIDLTQEPLGEDASGNPVFLRDIWPSDEEIDTLVQQTLRPSLFRQAYADVFRGDPSWLAIPVPDGQQYAWNAASTYIKHPPYFRGMRKEIEPVEDIVQARILVLLGDSITTDHISPAGNIKADSPAGHYLQAHGIKPAAFNSYGSRRGNDEVMVRGTFANIRLKNLMLDNEEGGLTYFYPDSGYTPEKLSIFDASLKYQAQGTSLVVLAGKEYGTGSSRDWAAKGTRLLGIKAVIAESFERIHRANLVGMGVLPLQFKPGTNIHTLGLDGSERISIFGLDNGKSRTASILVTRSCGTQLTFQVNVLLLTPKEITYYRHGGVLHYMLRQLTANHA